MRERHIACGFGVLCTEKQNGHIFEFLGSENRPPSTLEDQEEPNFGGHVCCLCLWCCLSVETAVECHMRVNEVFCAVSLSGTTTASSRLSQAQRGRDLLVAHASGYPLFNGVQFLCGADHFARRMLESTWVQRNMMLWCTELVSCASVCSVKETCCVFHFL